MVNFLLANLVVVFDLSSDYRVLIWYHGCWNVSGSDEFTQPCYHLDSLCPNHGCSKARTERAANI